MTMHAQEPPAPHPRERVSARMRRFLWVSLAVAVAGEGGHQLFDRYGTALGHHAFHIVMVGVATILFTWIVIRDIRANGRPHFSWRLSTSTERRSGR